MKNVSINVPEWKDVKKFSKKQVRFLGKKSNNVLTATRGATSFLLDFTGKRLTKAAKAVNPKKGK